MGANELELDQVINGDCLDILKMFPAKSIDLIFADPPYNLQLKNDLWRPNSTRVNGVEEAWDQFTDFEAYDRFTQEWLLGCHRVLKDTGTIWVIGSYHNIFRVGRIMQDIGFWILNDVVWIKNNPMPNFRGVRFTNAHETLIWAQKIKGNHYTFNYQTMKMVNKGDGNEGTQMRSDWRLPLCTGKERLKVNGEKAHPTQKPQSLLERVILSSSNPDDIILDPFFGTGTTGAVAKKFRRHWIGIESDIKYISIAKKRIDMISPDSAIDVIQGDEHHKKQIRIPFRSLLEKGYIHEGQVLYFGSYGDTQAIVLPNGHIKYGEIMGSIHKVGTEVQKAPCNGWLAWYYIEQNSGKREPIDLLRQKMRKCLRQENMICEYPNEVL